MPDHPNPGSQEGADANPIAPGPSAVCAPTEDRERRSGVIHVARGAGQARPAFPGGNPTAVAGPAGLGRAGPALAPQETENGTAVRGLHRSLDAVAAKLDAIAETVQVTEAFVAVGLHEKIAATMAKERAFAEGLLVDKTRCQRNLRLALVVLAVTIALLALEIRGDWISRALSEVVVSYGDDLMRAAGRLQRLASAVLERASAGLGMAP